MKKFSSIAFLLSAITGVSMLLLVSVFSLSARDAYDNRQIASQRLSDLVMVQDLLAAKTAVRLVQGRISTALETPAPESAAEMARILALQSAMHVALDVVTRDRQQQQASVPDFAPVVAAHFAYDKVAAQSLGVLRGRDGQSHAGLSNNGLQAATALVTALDNQSVLYASNIESTDTFTSEMMKVNRIVWKVREDAGPGRRFLVSLVRSGTKPTSQQLARIAEMDGRIAAPWAAIAADMPLPVMPAQVKTAFARANQIYFGDYRATRQELIDALLLGQAPDLSGQRWMDQTDPALDAMNMVANTALELSRAHIAAQLDAANRKLYWAVGLMALALMLAALTTIVVVFRIIRPLRLIVQTMKIVVKGDLKHTIPFKQRQDEIGEFARALKTFREQARERQKMESELLHNQVAKESAEASNRIKTEFLANMSHELRTPLNAVIGFSDMMRQKIFGPLSPQYEDYAVMINESGQLLLNLVSDILDIAKIEAGKFTLDCQTVDLAELVESCLRLVKKRADDRHVALVARLPATPVQFTVDPRGLKQILLNLLSNAIKFTLEGGRIEVIGEVVGERLKLTVRDNGVGIPAEALKRIGHAFEQASNDATRAREGTGLGLALVRALADQHGGSLAIDSIEHVGTTVTVQLPLSQEARKAA